MAGLIEEAAERLERNVHTGLLLTSPSSPAPSARRCAGSRATASPPPSRRRWRPDARPRRGAPGDGGVGFSCGPSGPPRAPPRRGGPSQRGGGSRRA
jgi:hypothetical protein